MPCAVHGSVHRVHEHRSEQVHGARPAGLVPCSRSGSAGVGAQPKPTAWKPTAEADSLEDDSLSRQPGSRQPGSRQKELQSVFEVCHVGQFLPCADLSMHWIGEGKGLAFIMEEGWRRRQRTTWARDQS
eukprot:scaffold1590_cov239-Pinguiococcus_pyrenoidosus.AAC.9